MFRVSVFLFCGAVLGFFAAYILATQDGPVADYSEYVGVTASRWWARVLPGRGEERQSPDGHHTVAASQSTPQQIPSTFIPLQSIDIDIPVEAGAIPGGGLTSWDDSIVIITGIGKIFLVGADGEVTRSVMTAPANGRAAYLQAATRPPFDKVQHDFSTFRYNDISSFETTRKKGLLVSYTKFHPDRQCYTTTISRLDISAATLSTVQAGPAAGVDIFSTAPCLPLKQVWRSIEGHMAGGRIAYDGKRTVYLASGDYAWDGVYGSRVLPGKDPATAPAVAQDPAADYGKVIAVDIETGVARQLARGHRNTQGIALDRDGRIWVVEHGARGGDELNLIHEGMNYGWPHVSYGTLYSGLAIPGTESYGRHDHYERPQLAWLPSIATSGLTRIEGFHPAWDGDLLVSSLSGRKLVRVRIAEGRTIFAESIEIGRRIRAVHQHTSGRIALWADDHVLVLLSPGAGGVGAKYIRDKLARSKQDPIVLQKIAQTMDGCMECHSFNPSESVNAPSLARVFGQAVGSSGYGGYSSALIVAESVWTRELLARYLTNPAAAFPGTLMPTPAIENDAVLEGVIDLLEGIATDIETDQATY